MSEDIALNSDETNDDFPNDKVKPLGTRTGKCKVVNNRGNELFRCRKCGIYRAYTHYFKATDNYLDTNGYMSVCKKCCDEMYTEVYKNEQTFEKTIFKMCRFLNIMYGDDIVDKTMAELQRLNMKHSNSGCFGVYKKFMYTSIPIELGKRDICSAMDLGFREPPQIVYKEREIIREVVETKSEIQPLEEDRHIEIETQIVPQEVLIYWGEGYNFIDYEFLETELSEWKRTHKSDTKAEETLLKEICHKQLEIRRARSEARPTSSLIKELQELMKTASVDPAKTAIAGAGKSQDTFSAFIKTIEENDPADFYKDKGVFKDYDDIGKYFEKYITRSLKNFTTGSKDFNINDDDSDDEDVDDSSTEKE